jgi:hypothetical protein
MAYDRNDPRQGPREERNRWSEDRSGREGGHGGRGPGGHDDRGFFERAGEQISSWFGDEDDDHRSERHNHERGDGGRESRDRGSGGERYGRDEYRPLAGDYGRSEGRPSPGRERHSPPPQSASSGDRGNQHRHDPHYQEWRQRQIDALDRDYDEYRREHQSKFENDFGSWRGQRQSKRQLLDQVREQMEVVGSDEQHVGTVDRISGDRIILTKSDSDGGGAHHSLSCSEIDRIDGQRLVLGSTAEQAKAGSRDENRERALFEREDQGQSGPHMLDRSFSGTYRKD